MKLPKVTYYFLSAAVLCLSFSLSNFACCAFFALVPLVLAALTSSRRQAAVFSYCGGFVFFFMTLFWLRHVTFLGLVVLSLYLAFYFACFGYYVASIAPAFSRRPFVSVLFIVCVWVVFEYIRGFLLTGFPWVFLGHSQYQNTGFIQLADTTGVWGVSFAVMMVNLCIVVMLRSWQGKKKKRFFQYAVFLIMIMVSMYGYGRHAIRTVSARTRGAPSLRVAALQGNVSQDEKWARIFRTRIKENYLSLSLQAIDDDPDMIIWPETAYPDYISMSDEYSYKEMQSFARQVSRPLLVGAVQQENESYFNSAFLFTAQGALTQTYKKIHLVPFGEYIPLRKYLGFLEQLVPIADFTAGETFTIFTVSNQRKEAIDFGVLICFEDTIAELAREFRLRGADFLVNMTNDAWFKVSASPYQHLQASVFRAIENRVFVIRAANTGISAVINNAGAVVRRVTDENANDVFVRGYIVADIKASHVLSLYTRFGDWFILVCIAHMLVFIIYIRKKYAMIS